MKSVLVAFLVACAISVSAFRWAEGPARDFLTVLGIDRATAEEDIFRSFLNDYVSHPTGDRVRAVVVGDRPSLIREVVQFARDYTASPRFLEAYATARLKVRPQPPEGPKTGEEMVAAMKAEAETQIADVQAQADQASGESKAMLLETVAMLKEQLAMLDDPDSPFLDPELQVGMAAGAAAEEVEYEAKVAEWEALYPEDPKARIVLRLEEVLAQCSDVDFTATLVEDDYGRKLFVNTAFEMKTGVWKACYRAGPESVDAAKGALGEWLASLR